jgi:hypothetical protein
MPTAEIRINVFNGRREPIPADTQLLVTARNGVNTNVVRKFVNGGAIHLTGLPVQDNFADQHTFLVSAKHHADAGFTPFTVKSNQPQTLDLMLLRREGGFTFRPFDELATNDNLVRLLRGDAPGDPRAAYEGLRVANPPALACLLNVTTALEQMRLAPSETADVNPMRSFTALDSAFADRMFAWAHVSLLEQVRLTAARQGAGGVALIETAPPGLHPGATDSFKQTDFGESNVQLSFHDTRRRLVNGVECMLVDVDIDYFKDTAAHLLMEVFPNRLKKLIHGKTSAESVTDPRLVYGLRWIAGRRKGAEFAPPYFLNA